MHRRFCEELLSRQVAEANKGSVRSRLLTEVSCEGTRALALAEIGERQVCLEFSGPNYDAEPLELRLRAGLEGPELELSEWPAGINFGNLHPVLGRPFCCIGGLFEYHCHPSHLGDPFDRYRYRFRLEDLLRILLDKAQV